MKNNFENSIKNKVEKFDRMPPDRLWTGISKKIIHNKMENKNPHQKIKSGAAIVAAAVIILAAIFWKINHDKKAVTNPAEQAPIAQRVTAGGLGKTANDLFPTELEMAGKQGKGIMAYVCMENCKYCTKFVNETLSRPEVHDYLEDRFIQVAVDLRDKKNRFFLKKHEADAAPSALFFSPDGTFLNKSMGAVPTENFMETAEAAWQILSGNPEEKEVAIVPDAKIFPNPNHGHFNIQLNAAAGAALIQVFNANGQEVYQEKQDLFTGQYEGRINLPNAQKGTYYLKITQGEQAATQKIIVQ
ncbi:MAG: T9SS type A sorting domain-containing protein [Bacteroidota bacterium]